MGEQHRSSMKLNKLVKEAGSLMGTVGKRKLHKLLNPTPSAQHELYQEASLALQEVIPACCNILIRLIEAASCTCLLFSLNLFKVNSVMWSRVKTQMQESGNKVCATKKIIQVEQPILKQGPKKAENRVYSGNKQDGTASMQGKTRSYIWTQQMRPGRSNTVQHYKDRPSKKQWSKVNNLKGQRNPNPHSWFSSNALVSPW